MRLTSDFWDVFLVFLVLQVTFVPFWEGLKIFDLLVLLIFLVTAFVRKVGFIYPGMFFLTVGVYTLLTIIQGMIWGWSPFSTFNSSMLIFFQPYLILLLFGDRFFILVERVFFVLTIIGLFLWVGINVDSGFENGYIELAKSISTISGDVNSRSILFFSHWDQLGDQAFGLSRFAGFFHEPGACAFFAVFMASLRFVRKGFVDRRFMFYFLIVLISFSTAGYLAFAMLFLGIIMSSKNNSYKFLVLIPVISGMVYAYGEVDFLQSKVQKQVAEQTQLGMNDETSGRIIGIRKSIYVLSKYPLYGRGLLSRTRPDDRGHPEYAKYGWLSWVSKLGLVAGSIYVFYFMVGYIKILGKHMKVSSQFKVLALLALFVNLTSQAFIETIPMMLIFFNGLVKRPLL